MSLGHTIVPDDELISSAREQVALDGSEFLGVIVIEGMIRITPNALGTLAADPRALIVDTTALDVVALLQNEGVEAPVLANDLDVRIPSPYWLLDWTPGSSR